MKIILDIFKKSILSIFSSIMILIILYPEVSKKVFAYFIFLQIWFIGYTVFLNQQSETNSLIKKWTSVATMRIQDIRNNISNFKKIYDELILYIRKDIN